MKTKIITLIISSLVFANCGSNPKETTNETNDSLSSNKIVDENIGNPESANLSDPIKDGSYCYETKRKEDGKSFTCPLTLVIKEGKVTATSPGDGYCGANYEGYQKGDTLFLKEDYEEPDGAIAVIESFWLLKEDKLSLFESVLDEKGKSVIKNPEKPSFVYIYNKVDCK